MTQHPLADALRTARNRLQRLALEMPHASRARDDANEWADEATKALAQYEKSDTDSDQLREALPDYIDLFRILRNAGRSDKAKATAMETLMRDIDAALASKTAIDPATVERVAAWLEDMPETERQAFNLHAAGMIGTKNRLAGGIARIGDHILPYLAANVRALGKDQ